MADVTLRKVDELTEAERTTWLRLVETQPEFDGPYFRPEFTELVAGVRDDVRVAVLSEGGQPVGFLPLQKRGRTGRPVAGRLSDFHAVIVEPNVEWSVEDLLRGCDLRSWQFDHLLASQEPFDPHRWHTAPSYALDLADGYDAYEHRRRDAGASDIKQALRKSRKLHREFDVRLETVADDSAFGQLLAWKSAQYQRTGLTDVFSFGWTVELLRRLSAIDEPGFGGEFAALYANDELLAVHFGMRSANVLHYWFPAIGDGWDKFSPGLVLLIEVARRAAARGLWRIDLGKGDERYKTQFGSSSIEVAEGVAEAPGVAGFVRRGWRSTKQWVKASPFAGAARVPARLLRVVRDRAEFE